MNLKETLIENTREYYLEAVRTEKIKHFNSSSFLFFKALFSLLDLHIYIKDGFVPSSHTKRFRILESKYPEMYKIIDELFPLYRGGYKSKLTKETCEVVRKNVERLFEILKVKI